MVQSGDISFETFIFKFQDFSRTFFKTSEFQDFSRPGIFHFKFQDFSRIPGPVGTLLFDISYLVIHWVPEAEPGPLADGDKLLLQVPGKIAPQNRPQSP